MFYKEQKQKKINLSVQRNKIVKNITSNEFSLLMERIGFFETNPSIAISYSGGSDSSALLLKLSEWSKKNNAKLYAFIINHGLKTSSLEDSNKAKTKAESLSVETHILYWRGIKPKSAVMKKARDKRYELILSECKKRNIYHIFTAHHLDDQIETYYMRSQRKGFNLGHSSMNVISEKKYYRIIKPFLHIAKERLIATCNFHGFNWIDDPFNKMTDFERVKTRETLHKKSKREKVMLANEIQNKKRAKEKFEKNIASYIFNNLIFQKYGLFTFKKSRFLRLEESLKYEFLKRLLLVNSGKEYGPNLKSIQNLVRRLQENKLKITLHSSIIELKGDIISIYRECRKTFLNNPKQILVKKNESFLWDYRFKLLSTKENILLQNINEFNIYDVKKRIDNRFGFWLPSYILQTLPLIKKKNIFFIPFISSSTQLSNNGIEFFFKPKYSLTSNKINIGI